MCDRILETTILLQAEKGKRNLLKNVLGREGI